MTYGYRFRRKDRAFIKAVRDSIIDMPAAQAMAIQEPGGGLWYIHVVKCPYCGGQHRHGGVRTEQELMWGTRFAHCQAEDPGEYGLVPYRGSVVNGTHSIESYVEAVWKGSA